MATSGPFVTDIPNDGNFAYRQWKYKTVPTNKKSRSSLPYMVEKIWAKGGWGTVMTRYALDGTLSQAERDRMYVIAYDRFHSRAFDKSSLGLTTATMNQSLGMITKRCSQIWKAARALKNFRWKEFSDALDLDSRRRALRKKGKFVEDKYFDKRYFERSAAKNTADTWLEYTFGWAPLLKDIGDSINVLQQDFGEHQRCQGKAKSFHMDSWTDSGRTQALRCYGECLVRGTIQVTNPNLLLANQLGFTNPAEVVWDAVPFSFVVDWFIPVNKFLKSFSNEVGYQVLNRTLSFRAHVYGYFRHVGDNSGKGYTIRAFRMDRAIPLSFPRPEFSKRTKLFEVSPWLAGTSASLAAQQLTQLLPDWRRVR